MATTLHPSRNDTGANVANNFYQRPLMTDHDFKDNRYPTLSPSQSRSTQRSGTRHSGTSDRLPWEASPSSDPRMLPMGFTSGDSDLHPGWTPIEQQRPQTDAQLTYRPTSRQKDLATDVASVRSQSQQSQELPRTSLSYVLPTSASRRVVERYSLDDEAQRAPSRTSAETRQTVMESNQDASRSRAGTPVAQRINSQPDRSVSTLLSGARSTVIPTAGIGSGAMMSNNTSYSPIMPLSASPTYSPPVAPKHRAYPQQPTYITPSNSPKPVKTVYTPTQVQPREEVCVECAMRDQDMADVDVNSPGIWTRASDADYEDLKQRELEDEAKGVVTADGRPRAVGGRLTEQNLKMWLSINPKEPASRLQTLNIYLKSQRVLLEAEASAHARAMQEAKQLDNQVQELRRSAYDMGNIAPADDSGRVRIKAPQSPSLASLNPAHLRAHSRDITLLENGIIVEHVDVRKEEQEARERKRREEKKRGRKSSRVSVMDVTSVISGQHTDSGVGLKPYSRYSQASSARPTSVLTAPERPNIARAVSQASFSDVHSLSSASPRRSRFFGLRNPSTAWRSQDSLAPSAFSGSMVNMHVALQRESHQQNMLTPVDINSERNSRIWPSTDLDADRSIIKKKKKNGLARIWRIVMGSGKNESVNHSEITPSHERDDDLPLAPPPPLSYLVSRGPSDIHPSNHRHASTPSLPSTVSPRVGMSSPGMSPSTAPSSVLPSPPSSRLSGPDIEVYEARYTSNGVEEEQRPYQDDESVGKLQTITNGYHNTEPDTRLFNIQGNQNSFPISTSLPGTPNRDAPMMSRDKSLPPIPPTESTQYNSSPDSRLRTVYTFNPRALPPGSAPAHDFLPPHAPFRTGDIRRQSFGGLSSRPNIAINTMPANIQNINYENPNSFGPRYDEFGLSRRSLGRLEHASMQIPSLTSPAPSAKRKSKFGFGSLLGKKSKDRDQVVTNDVHPFPSMRNSDSDKVDDLATNGYSTSSRHSGLSMSGTNSNLRMSVTSRKGLEDLVSQDAEFLAYRYPSNEQHLDLLR